MTKINITKKKNFKLLILLLIIVIGSGVISGCGLIDEKLEKPINRDKIFYDSFIFNEPNIDKEKDILFPINDNELLGFVNKAGEILIEPQFETYNYLLEGLCEVTRASEKMVIDCMGEVIFRHDYDYTGIYSEGLMAFFKDNKCGFVDNNGNVIIKPVYDDVSFFSEGMAAVLQKDKWGFIDRTGKLVIKPQYDAVEYFTEGLCVAKNITFEDGMEIYDAFYIDMSNNVIFEGFDDARPFSENLAFVREGDGWACIDKFGNWITEPIFTGEMQGMMNDFKDGRAMVAITDEIGAAKFGYINYQGEYVIQPEYDSLEPVSEGMIAFSKANKYGFLNSKGNVAIQPILDGVSSFSEGLAVAEFNGKFGYIDKSGYTVISPQFTTATVFWGGLAYVSKDIYKGLIDRTGEWVWKTVLVEDVPLG